MNKKEYRIKTALGFCARYGCMEPPHDGRKLCWPHVLEHREYNRKWKKAMVEKKRSEEWRRVWRKTA